MIPPQELARTRIGANLTSEQLTVLGQLAELREYTDGEVIVGREDAETNLYVLLDGRAEVRGSFEQEVYALSQGSFIGELAFLDRKPRSAAVCSLGSSRVAIFSHDLFAQLRAEHPEIVAQMYENLAMTLCEKVRRATRLIDALSVMEL